METTRDTTWDLTITREFKAPVELVFKAWTDLDMMNEWLNTEDWKITCTGVFEVGSRVKQEMTSDAFGSIGYLEPLEIIENEKVVMRSWWDMKDGNEVEITTVTLTFEKIDESLTRFTYNQTFDSENTPGRGEEQFEKTLQMFADYIEPMASDKK